MTIVLLPRAPNAQPNIFNGLPRLESAISGSTLAEAREQLKKTIGEGNSPVAFIGSEQTPALSWFSAMLLYPKASLWYWQQEQEWVALYDGQPGSNQQSVSVLTAQAPKAKEEKAETKPLDLKSELNEVFKLHVWQKPEAAKLLTEAKERFATNKQAQGQLDGVASQAALALNLAKKLEQRWHNGEPPDELESWVKNLKQPGRIKYHLTVKLGKLKSWRQTNAKRTQANRGFNVSIPQYQLSKGLHHQSLHQLPTSHQWRILIDETGTQFDANAEELNLTNTRLGRVVALALPQNSNLKALEKKHHSSELTLDEQQELLKAVLTSNSGVFGCTVKDFSSYNWIAAVQQLCRWALLMLPINGMARVKIIIEQRAPYASTAQLQALCETLENELKQLAPERFAELHLSLEIMGKDHPHNGYVDAIANAWGSSDDNKRRLLARTGWRDSCLLQNNSLSNIERFYQRVSLQPQLTPNDWFELCNLASHEPQHSFLSHLLNKHQQLVTKDAELWLGYLQEVKYRVVQKRYNPASLKHALEWLSQHGSQQLTPLLELMLLSLIQAANNHYGLLDAQQAERCLELAAKLRDEAPQEACDAALRVAISSTHAFEFVQPRAHLEEWLKLPVAVPGLANYAKLQSTLGQLYAFAGNHQTANMYFDAACKRFDMLSDPEQRAKELQQSKTYLTISLLDSHHPEADKLIHELLPLKNYSKDNKVLKALCRSGDNERFRHYLLLRYAICKPENQQLRDFYLGMSNEWQLGEGHPWMLINAYRAWLLKDAGQNEQARGHLQCAIDDCINSNSPLLIWMAQVFTCLGQSLQLNCQGPAKQQWPSYLPSNELNSMAEASTHDERMMALNKLLPFNFH